MRKHRYIALTALLALVVSACSSSTPSPSSAPAASAPAASSTTAASTEPSASAAASPSAAVLAPDPAEAVIKGVEPNAEISFWTFYLSPPFDKYIKDTIARFEAT